MTIRAILLDLDGTIVMTREASWALFQRVNERFKLGIDNRELFFDLFRGRGLLELPRICGDDARGKAAIDYFMELLRSEYKPDLVPGMVDVIRKLNERYSVWIVSGNAHHAIARIVEDAGLGDFVSGIYAGDIEPDKRKNIRAFLESSSGSGHGRRLAPDEVVLVTDTVGDIHDAGECGIHAVGVTWGMHPVAALREAGAAYIAKRAEDILEWADAQAAVGGRASSVN